MITRTDASPAEPPRKPRWSLFFATVGGVGYLPKAPGTWGSLVGVLLYWGLRRCFLGFNAIDLYFHSVYLVVSFLALAVVSGLFVALFGVATSGRVARFTVSKDPQFVVIDEVSGQYFTYLFAVAPLNWKYLLLGFILFRVFDIWKPFPARQAESLPGGWGIMADDWIAAVYAAIGIWIARGIGL
ncbi:MAG: phosphatidylglycerophosphatase A family protein [Candidatus Acidiferrales bacterium]